MAHAHLAFSFDPAAAAAPLLGDVDAVRRKLRGSARAVTRRPNAVLREALTMVRFDESWLGGDPEQGDVDARCLMVCLLAECRPAPSLGRPGGGPDHLVLAAFLRGIGWPDADVRRLTLGDPLSAWLDRVGAAALAPAVTGLDDLGGWLDEGAARALRARLAGVDPSEARRVAPVAATFGATARLEVGDERARVERALSRADAMLAAASEGPGRALIILSD